MSLTIFRLIVIVGGSLIKIIGQCFAFRVVDKDVLFHNQKESLIFVQIG